MASPARVRRGFAITRRIASREVFVVKDMSPSPRSVRATSAEAEPETDADEGRNCC